MPQEILSTGTPMTGVISTFLGMKDCGSVWTNENGESVTTINGAKFKMINEVNGSGLRIVRY